MIAPEYENISIVAHGSRIGLSDGWSLQPSRR